MFLFSGGCPSAYIKQSLFIHSTSGNGGKPVKKIPASATVLPTMKVEVQSPYNRISISHNRKGHKAFAVFLFRKDYRFKALKFDRRRGILYLHFILSCLLSERRKHCKDSRKKSPPCTVV